jgi:REP element-mobilizing transposase RayT
MPRPIREDYPGAWHHVMNRGACRAAIFKVDEHCVEFLYGLHLMVEKYGIEVHGYSLMPNHFHLLVRSSPDIANLSRSIGDLLGSYSRRVNALHRWDGPIFKGRFKSQLLKHESYLFYLLAYIHLNPVRGHLVNEADEECWTSHRAYMRLDKKPEWLTCGTLLRQVDGRKGLKKMVDGLRRKSVSWPEFLDLMTVIFIWNEAPPEAGKGKKGSILLPKPSDTIKQTIDRVCEITDCKKRELKRVVMGPRANPARRFAIWALDNTRLPTHRQIAMALDMSVSHVSKQLSRMKKDFPESLSAWREEWESED